MAYITSVAFFFFLFPLVTGNTPNRKNYFIHHSHPSATACRDSSPHGCRAKKPAVSNLLFAECFSRISCENKIKRQ